MVTPIRIGAHQIGLGAPCFIIAEGGVNHNGDVELARQLIDAAARVGANAIKFQTFEAEKLVVASAPKADYQTKVTDPGESQLAMIKRLELTRDDFRQLKEYCDAAGIMFLSTPFDEGSADFLEELGMAAFKIPSGELTNAALLAHIARKGRPMLISTGMASLEEVRAAVDNVRREGCRELVLLQCVSNYPAAAADVNLRAMHTMAEEFDAAVGYSDHAEGTAVCLAAVALGACAIEKHLTLDQTLPGPDHMASIEPDEFAEMVRGIHIVQASLGHGRKEPAASEANTASVARRSLVAAFFLPADTLLREESIAVRRPGTGLPPSMRDQLVGRRTRVAIPAGALLTLEMLA